MKLKDLKVKKVHEILEIPGTWTQEQKFRNQDKEPCGYQEATCACMMGLIAVVYGTIGPVYSKLSRWLGVSSVVFWNDNPARTQEEVQKLCKELDI